MIRDLGPILLIPAAWALTFATVVFPGYDVYWIQHMHYFITLFLAGFTLTSWKEMDSKVLRTWRNVIGLGIPATLAGAISFHTGTFPDVLASISLFYWLSAPGIAAYYTNQEMKEYSKAFRFIGYAGVTALLLYLQGYVVQSDIFKTLGLITAAISQSYSIVIAAKMDGNL